MKKLRTFYLTVADLEANTGETDAPVFCVETQSWYVYYALGGGYNPNGITVIQSCGGPGRWLAFSGALTEATDEAQEAEQNALADMWDNTAKTLTLEGGTANPALVVSGGQGATYGPELLTNPDFTGGLTGWTANSGVEWVDGEAWFYPGVIATHSLNAGGTGYQVGDVLTLSRPVTISPTNMTNNNTPAPYVVSCSSAMGNSTVYCLFGGSGPFTTYPDVPSGGTPINIMIDMGSAVSVGGLGWKASADNYFPGTFLIQGSNYSNANHSNPPGLNVDADWTTVSTQTSQPYPGNGIMAKWFFDSATYRYWRIHVTGNTGTGSGWIYTQGMELYTIMEGYATITVATLSGSAVATYTLSSAGRLNVIGVVPVTGGSGSGCKINVLTLTTGRISQNVSLINGETYCFVPTFSSGVGGARFEATTPDGASEATIGGADATWDDSGLNGLADPDMSRGWGGPVSGTSGTVTVWLWSTDLAVIGKVATISYKRVTGFVGDICQIHGSDDELLLAIKNSGGSSFSLGIGRNNLAKYIMNQGNIAIGANILTQLVGGYGNIGIGEGCLDGVISNNANVAIGWKAGKNFAGDQLTALGWWAGLNAVGNYLTCLGAAAGINCSSGSPAIANMSVYIGFWTAQNTIGSSNIIISADQGGGSNRTVSNCLIISPRATNDFIYGIHDSSGTTGYLNLRGDFNPSTADTYELGADGTEWNKAWVNEVKAVTKFGLGLAPIAPRAHVADAAGGTEVATINSILATLEAFGLHLAS
jgi:hypothetical protein